MPRIPNLTVTESEVSQEIDLKEFLGMDVSNNAPMKAAIGQWMIDRILQRTANGEDAFGKSFHKYSKEYEHSLMFQAFKQSKSVNLELTGDMLSSVDIMSDKGNKLKIGIKDSEQATKAYAHMTAFKGHPTLDGIAPKRAFFGLSEDDLKDMRKEFSPDIVNSRVDHSEKDALFLKLQSKADKIIGDFFFGTEDQGN